MPLEISEIGVHLAVGGAGPSGGGPGDAPGGAGPGGAGPEGPGPGGIDHGNSGAPLSEAQIEQIVTHCVAQTLRTLRQREAR